MRTVEIETLAEFDRAAAAAGAGMRGWQVQDLDLTERDEVLRRLDPGRSLFLGCTFAPGTEDLLRQGGALVFPRVPHVPFDPWRAALYSPAELYDDLAAGYEATPDARIYAWWRKHAHRPKLQDTLAMALHDNSIHDALDEYVDDRRIVGVMGGHALRRNDPGYAAAAHLGRALARTGHTVATGGGPGAMEAANLGALLADATADQLDGAIAAAAAVPSFLPDVAGWARAGLAAVAGLPHSDLSLGVPTWFYGHEPPNPFTSAIAKYFANAIREDILLHVSRAGIVFLPGSAGTVQEVFQAACENYYAAPSLVAPMVLVGRDYWTRELPAWPLLDALGGSLTATLQLVDRAEDAVAALGQVRR
jgi:predicted Rossmann-fold nucleotide-binding protein